MGSCHNSMQELLIKPRHSKVFSEERLMKWGREGKHLQRTLQTLVFWASSFVALRISKKATKCISLFGIKAGTKLLSSTLQRELCCNVFSSTLTSPGEE